MRLAHCVQGQCSSFAGWQDASGCIPGLVGQDHRRVSASFGDPCEVKWSGKTLVDHKADRKAFVAQALAAVGIEKPTQDPSRLIWRKVEPGDPP